MADETIRFWVDPICPWCWVTARWAIEVAPQRGLSIEWMPISLLMKNETPPDSPHHAAVAWTLGLLRVMESVRSSDGNAPLQALYLEYGRRIHHDKDRLWDVSEALRAVGIDEVHAKAVDDEQWDAVVRAGMDEGLALVGKDVGTPIIAIQRADDWVATFGPVITRVPDAADSLRLWDAFVTLTTMDGFWEIKRTRTESPDFGQRP
jgi:predicted DsbA family dithiol-disulfide isomerase